MNKTPTPKDKLPKGMKPGRGRSGVTTKFGERNALFQIAKKASGAKKSEAVSKMAAIQPLSKREAKILA